MNWSVALVLCISALLIFGVLSYLLDKIAVRLFALPLTRRVLDNRWLLWGVHLIIIFVLPWAFCGGVTLLAVQLQSNLLATLALAVGFPSLILIPFLYAALLTRLRRLQHLTN